MSLRRRGDYGDKDDAPDGRESKTGGKRKKRRRKTARSSKRIEGVSLDARTALERREIKSLSRILELAHARIGRTGVGYVRATGIRNGEEEREREGERNAGVDGESS